MIVAGQRPSGRFLQRGDACQMAPSRKREQHVGHTRWATRT
jgi:hypothetical protein